MFHRKLLPPLFLLFCSALYCHRFYGSGFFSLEGDAALWAFIRLNPGLMWGEHLPHGYYYSSLFNWSGPANPVALIFTFFFSLLKPFASEVHRAIALCMTISFASTSLLALSVYYFLTSLGRSLSASLIGAIVVTFTGFHLVAIREFSVGYQISFAMVPPLLFCVYKLYSNARPTPYIAGAGLAIGFSLLGGTNVPLFYYLPLTLLLPFLQLRHSRERFFSMSLHLGLACALGFAIGAATLLPGIFSLWDSNRTDVDFVNIMHSTSPFSKLTTLFLRDWWGPGQGTYHEQDAFLGLPVIFLLLIGLIKKPAGEGPRIIRWFLAAVLITGVVVMHHSFLPGFLFEGIRFVGNVLSFRNSNRFFLLCLLPIAYFVSGGFDTDRKKGWLAIGFLLLCLQQYLIETRLLPRHAITLPDHHLASYLSLSIGTVVLLGILAEIFFPKAKRFRYATPPLLFLLYYFAPIQFTHYPIPFMNDRSLLGHVDKSRLDWTRVLGLKSDYDKIFRQAEYMLDRTPLHLLSVPPGSGRIWDQNGNDVFRTGHFNFMGNRIGREFAFLLPDHHTTSRHIHELYKIKSEPLLDLLGICWIVPPANSPLLRQGNLIYPFKTTHAPLVRTSCFPKAWGATALLNFQSDKEVLSWMKEASRSQLQKAVAVNCEDSDCPELPFPQPVQAPVVRRLLESPGEMQYAVNAPEGGYLTLSTLYHPEWRAEISGKTVKPIRTNHAFMSFPVPKGNHEVKLTLTHFRRNLAFFITFCSVLLGIFLVSERKTVRRRVWFRQPMRG